MAPPKRVDFLGRFGCFRGKTFAFDVTGIAIDVGNLQSPNVRVLCTVKRYPQNDADPGLAQLDTNAGDELVRSETALRLEFTPDDTDGWPSGVYPSRMHVFYDVQLCIGTDVKTIQRGYIAVHEPPTHARSSPPSNPLSFWGARNVYWCAPENWSAASWPDETGNLTLAQATVGERFTNSGTINDVAVPTSDGVDDSMQGDLVTPVPIGARPTVWFVARCNGTDYRYLYMITNEDVSAFILDLEVDHSPGGYFYSNELLGPNPITNHYQVYYDTPTDGEPHLFEYSWEADSTPRLRIDGVLQTGYFPPSAGANDPTGAVRYPLQTISIAGHPFVVGSFEAANIADNGIALNVTDAERAASFYPWITYRWGIVLP